MKKNKISTVELLLLALMFLCFLIAIYFIFQDHSFLSLLFFLLHSCVGLLFFLVSHNRLILEYVPEQELSYERNTQRQLLADKTREANRLHLENEKYRKKEELLKKELEAQRKELEALRSALQLQEEQTGPNYASAEYGQLLPTPENKEPALLDLIAVVSGVIEEMQPYTRKAGIQVQLSNAGSPVAMKADPQFLRILFRNVIDNSIKYMKRIGCLIITVSNIGEDIFIVLKDNGFGLSSEETRHIFELNYQGSNRVSGNGLGLTQAKAIVEYYGGTIYAKSGSDNGMSIYIQLPSALNPSSKSQKETAEQSASGLE